MINHVTKGIKISVNTIFDGSYFKNYTLNYSFSYTITITNQSKNTVQLKSRHWRILDSLNNDIIIDGEGVIGEKPTIGPGDSFVYSSGCLITSPVV